MIERYHAKSQNSFTEGFEIEESGLQIIVKEGILKCISSDATSSPIYDLEGNTSGYEQNDEKRIKEIRYPEITFKIEPEERHNVKYDLYLIQKDEEGIYHLERTVLADSEMQSNFTGEYEPTHHLLELIVPALADSLEYVPVYVKLLQLDNEKQSL